MQEGQDLLMMLARKVAHCFALAQQSSIGCNLHDTEALTNTLQDFPRINTEGAGHVCA